MNTDALQDIPRPFTFANSQQESIFLGLLQIGLGPAGFFRDACYLMSLEGPLPITTTHLVAHLLREVNGSLVDVIAPLGDSSLAKDSEAGETTRFRAALKFLRLQEDDELAKKWHGLLKGVNCFSRYAHRCDLSGPRLRTDAFDQWFTGVMKVLEIVLDRYRARFLRITDYIDTIVEMDQPPKDIRRRIPASELTYSYLFGRLKNPRWLPDLKEKDFFSLSSSNVSSAAPVAVHQYWPQAQYLKKIAATGDRTVQEQMINIMLDIGATNNDFIHTDFTEAALAMPSDLAAQWAEHETLWLGEGNKMHGFLEENLGKLISKLAKEGKPDVALRLAAELLAVLHDPEEEKKRYPKSKAERIAFSSLQPSIRCEQYNYEQVLKENIPDLAEAVPFETLELLCALLKNAVLFSQPEEERHKSRDAAYIWRPAIEDHEQNDDYTIDGPLITAARDTAEAICKRNPDKIGEMVKSVESHKWDIFRRIGLHLLRVAVNPPISMVEDRLVNEYLFNHPGVHHEYFHLIKARFRELSPEGQERILAWIDGAVREKKSQAEHEGDLKEEQKAKRIRYWQYRKLIPIQEYLTDEWKQRFSVLKGEFKEQEMPPDFLAYSWPTRIGGPESPKKPAELALMSPDELFDFLKTWKPSGELMASTPDSLGSALGALVEEQPDRYAAEIGRFMDVNMDPTYVRHIISGFCRALESDKPLPYAQVFKLCKWVVNQPTDISGRVVPKGLRDGLEVDRTWRNARIEIARLLEKSFEDKSKLPFEFREEAWAIIRPLTDDPEPDVEYEKKYGGDNMDLSLNTIRGKALHCVMYYAMWVYRKIKEDVQIKERRTPAFKDLPEVLTILNRRLDPSVDRSQTSRAVYGQWLPQLTHLGPDWVTENLARLFPQEPDLKPLRDAVWHTYLLYGGRIYSSVTKIAMDIYREEVLRLKGKQIGGKMYKSPETRLAEHIVLLYLWGEYGLEDNSLIDMFFKIAPSQLTVHTMDFLGRDTHDAKTHEPVITERMKALWDWRVERVGGPDKMPNEELSAFGWWFAGGQFDAAWALSRLEETLKRTGVSRSSMQVCERLSALFSGHPREALRCLRLFIDKNADPWFFLRARKQQGAWTLLEQAMNSKDDAVRDKAEEIIHLLGSKGYLEYREMLRARQIP